jgi:hypothetical protein
MRLLSMMRNDEREHEAPIHDECRHYDENRHHDESEHNDGRVEPYLSTKVSHTLLTERYADKDVQVFIWSYDSRRGLAAVRFSHLTASFLRGVQRNLERGRLTLYIYAFLFLY